MHADLSGGRPKVPKDYGILLNLVELVQIVLPVSRPDLFGGWVYLYCR